MKQETAKMVLELENIIETERLVAVLTLGLCMAIEHEAIGIEEAEDHLFSPYTMEQLQALGVSQVLIDAIHLGTELEDVASLLPEKLGDSLAEIKRNALDILESGHDGDRRRWIKIVQQSENIEFAAVH